jgi:uncharacterized membrane protein YheB (UPF0754 family)
LTYLIPALVGAAIGYSTNWLALKMLFRPRNAVFFFGRRLPFTPGLMVRRKGEFARSIARTAEHQFADPRHMVKVALQANDDGKIWNAVKGVPIVSTAWIKYCETVTRRQMGGHVEAASRWVQDQGVVQEVVEKKINEMHMEDVEDMVTRVSGKEMGAIAWAGAALGFLVGLIQPFIGRIVEMLGVG